MVRIAACLLEDVTGEARQNTCYTSPAGILLPCLLQVVKHMPCVVEPEYLFFHCNFVVKRPFVGLNNTDALRHIVLLPE